MDHQKVETFEILVLGQLFLKCLILKWSILGRTDDNFGYKYLDDFQRSEVSF